MPLGLAVVSVGACLKHWVVPFLALASPKVEWLDPSWPMIWV